MRPLFYRAQLHMLPWTVLLSLLCALLAIGIVQVSQTYAAGGASFTLQPATVNPTNPLSMAYFILAGKPGTVLQESVVVKNVGTATGTLSLYAVDAGTGQNSGIIYLPQNAPRTDVGAWIHLSMSRVTLAAGQSKVVSFQVVIPRKARAGQHVGGIVAEDMEQNSTTTNSRLQITVHSRRVIAVEVNLPGPQVEQLSATGIQVAGSTNYEILKVGLSNTGTMLLKAKGTLQVVGSKGQELQNLTMSVDSLLPGTSIAYPLYVQKKALGVGKYQGKLLLKYGHGKLLNYTTTFIISEQQVVQIFNNNGALTLPATGSSLLSRLSPLQLLGGAFVVMVIASLIILYWVKKLYQATAGTVLAGQRGKAGRNKGQKSKGQRGKKSR